MADTSHHTMQRLEEFHRSNRLGEQNTPLHEQTCFCLSHLGHHGAGGRAPGGVAAAKAQRAIQPRVHVRKTLHVPMHQHLVYLQKGLKTHMTCLPRTCLLNLTGKTSYSMYLGLTH